LVLGESREGTSRRWILHARREEAGHGCQQPQRLRRAPGRGSGFYLHKALAPGIGHRRAGWPLRRSAIARQSTPRPEGGKHAYTQRAWRSTTFGSAAVLHASFHHTARIMQRPFCRSGRREGALEYLISWAEKQ